MVPACGGSRPGLHLDPAEALRGLAPRRDPPLALDDDDDLQRALAHYRALAEVAPARAVRRRELWTVVRTRAERALAAGRPDQAFVFFTAGLSLWHPRELRDGGTDLLAPAELADLLLQRLSRRGSANETIAALAVLIAARPDRRAEYQRQFDEIDAYLDDLAVAEGDVGARGSRTIEAMEHALLVFPSPWVAETVVKRYLARNEAMQRAIASGNSQDPTMSMLTRDGVMTPVSNVIRAYALTDRIDDAKPVVEKLAKNAFDEESVREHLDRALAPDASGEDWLRLARDFLREQVADRPREVPLGLTTALRVCETAANRLPRATEPRTCAGAVAADLRLIPLSVRWLEEAQRVNPNDFAVVDYLARLYDRQLRDFMAGERIDAGKRQLGLIERFHADVKRRFPQKTLGVPLSDAHMVLAQGLFNVGEIDEAAAIWRKAAAEGAKAEALEQLGLIHLKRGQWDEAARAFEQSVGLPRETPVVQLIDRARLKRLAGEAQQGAGRADQASAAFRASLAHWEELHKRIDDLPSFQAAQVSLGRARVLFYLGRRADAIAALEEAIKVDDRESSTYADAISFLLTRGQFAAALDAYHRALGREEVSEYFKVYTSLWIIDFARLRKLEPDPLAIDYLAIQDGTRWYHDLARYRSGKLTYDQLYGHADTRGKRAEAYFYEAMARYARGSNDLAEKLLRHVLATDMLGFFEYDMARYFLEHGPPR
jgi:tetratricopeptide (TPR) repeat protein